VIQHARAGNGRFHAVRFYEDERSLCRIVADFLGDGLVAGEPVVVIATPVHRDGIARALEALSFDISRLQANRELLIFDADQTLATFMIDGVPDPDAFRQSIGGMLEAATAGRPEATVRAYGEMVDCLWKNDAADAAIRLEVLWNELATTRAFSLLCGYSIGNFYKHGAYEQICGEHTHVVSTMGQRTRVGIA